MLIICSRAHIYRVTWIGNIYSGSMYLFLASVLYDRYNELGDEIVLVGHLDHIIRVAHKGEELKDETLLGDAIESCRVVVLRSKVKKQAQGPRQLVEQYGCFPATIQRVLS